MWSLLCGAAALLWCAVLLVPWRPWRNGEVLEVTAIDRTATTDMSDITTLIPARDEADHITTTLTGLAAQGGGIGCLLVDDRSDDDTAQVARRVIEQTNNRHWQVVKGQPLEDGWSGKLWALEQGYRQIDSRYILLLDADITLKPGVVAALRRQMQQWGAPFASILATPHMVSGWERLLMPAFVYFFKLLYPFRLSNHRSRRVAAAAGGCILLERRLLTELGGFSALKGALIDDCTLARKVTELGERTWMGQSREVISTRATTRLSEIADMVARTAYTQLRYSVTLLLLCTLLMGLCFWVPLAGLLAGNAPALAALAYTAMAISYLPTLKWYDRSLAAAFILPVSGTLFLGMTWLSALRYWRGERSRWKGRSYRRQEPTASP